MASGDKKFVDGMGEVVFDINDAVAVKKAAFSAEPLSYVKKIPLTAREDDRGCLLKDIQSPMLPKDSAGRVLFGEHYNIINPAPMIRGFHVHRELWDFFCIILGKAKFVLVDARVSIAGKENPTYLKYNEFVLSDRSPATLVVPPGVYHGWRSYVDNTVLSSTGTHLYDPNNLDEHRVDYRAFGYSWETQIK